MLSTFKKIISSRIIYIIFNKNFVLVKGILKIREESKEMGTSFKEK